MLRLEGSCVRALNVAKGILDHRLHAPIMYFQSIVDEALMIEPTESFEKEELNRFVRRSTKGAEAYLRKGAVSF